MTNLLHSIYLYAAGEGDHVLSIWFRKLITYAYSGKKLILVYFYLYICHWILDISIIYSEISASKYHGIHVDYIDELQHDFISPACSSMKPVNCVYSLILNPLSLIFFLITLSANAWSRCPWISARSAILLCLPLKPVCLDMCSIWLQVWDVHHNSIGNNIYVILDRARNARRMF